MLSFPNIFLLSAPDMLPALRAKGTLISEPRFSTPCEMRFFPRDIGNMAIFKEKAIFLISRGKNRISQGVENRGSLICVPLALRVINSGKGGSNYFSYFSYWNSCLSDRFQYLVLQEEQNQKITGNDDSS